MLSLEGLTSVLTKVQAKRWSHSVSGRVVRELRGALRVDERGLIVTTAELTPEAFREAATEGKAKIGLLGGDAHRLGHQPEPDVGLRSGRHAGLGGGRRHVIEATDVGEPIAPYGQDLPAPGRIACLASGRRAGDFKPDQKCAGVGGHLSDRRSYPGGSRAGPPREDLVAVVAAGVVRTLRRAPPGAGDEQIPDGIQTAGFTANLTRSVSAAGSCAALASSGMRISLALPC